MQMPSFLLKIGGLVCAVVLLWEVPSINAQKAGPAEFNPASVCTAAHLDDLSKLNPSAISSLTQGIQGLPCDAAQEGPPTPTDPRKLQHGFDYYSWLTFIALNSPDAGGPIGKDARTVWEKYKQLPYVMLEQGKRPEDWKDDNTPIESLKACADKGKLNPGTIVVHMELEETYNEPFKTGPLFDQNGNYALFGIFLNEQMFRYIANPDHPLYSREGQKLFKEEVNFPSGNSKDRTLGAVMIKTSWRLLKEGVDYGPNVQPQYHIADGILYRPKSADPCRPVKLGLIGFHVGHKTVSRQQWIWTTFEHNKNVPTEEQVKNGIPKDGTFTFYDPACKTCAINETPSGSWEPDVLGWVPFEKPSRFKSQIVRTGPGRIFPDEDDVDALNKLFHAWPQIRENVWANYDLINTQWPSAFPCATNEHPEKLPDATCAPFPMFLANTTLETFSQPNQAKSGVPLATSSCISCHNNATTYQVPAMRSDFTYILEKAKSEHDPPN